MRTKVFLSLILLLAGFFVFTNELNADESNNLIINEVMYAPDAINGKKTEWVEMIAVNDITLKLKSNGQIENFYLCTRKNKTTGECDYIATYSPDNIQHIRPGDYVIFTNDPVTLVSNFNIPPNTLVLKTSNSFSLLDKDSSTNKAIVSYSFDNKLTWSDEIYYGNLPETKTGYSLERISADKNNWKESYILSGTPGIKNFTGNDITPLEIPKEEELPIATSAITLRINEIFPNPSQKGEANEFIEIYNFGQESISLTNIILQDRNKKECPLNLFANSLAPADYLLVENKKNSACKITVHNSDGAFSLYNSMAKNILSTASFIKSAETDLSYNFDGSSWRWSKHRTPGETNIFNNLPQAQTRVPEKVYKDTYAEFLAKGSDKDKEKLKYTWDFGDGHKSYLAVTHHKYAKAGKYSVLLKISDGSEDKLETFEVKVEKFPKLDVKLVGLSPNPSGADTGAEFLNILNNTKKKINLNGWSIASGTKTLANHPIVTDFFIKPKEIAKLTYAISKFTLPNGNGKIELRYPNGEVASKIKYKGLGKTVMENATYVKTKAGWNWSEPVASIAIAKPAQKEPLLTAREEAKLKPIAIATPEEIDPNPEITENLGKFSASMELKNKKQNRSALLKFGLNPKIAFRENIPPTSLQNISFENPSDQNFLNNLFLQLDSITSTLF